MTTEQALSIVAHYEMARGMSEAVPEMSGFVEFYASKLRPAERKLLVRYQAAKETARTEFVALLEKDKEGK